MRLLPTSCGQVRFSSLPRSPPPFPPPKNTLRVMAPILHATDAANGYLSPLQTPWTQRHVGTLPMTPSSFFLLAVTISLIIVTVVLAVMYVAVKDIVTTHYPCGSPSSHHHQPSPRPCEDACDPHDDDYGTFGRRLKVYGKFSGSMASLQDAAELPQKHSHVSPWTSASPGMMSQSFTSSVSPQTSDNCESATSDSFYSAALPASMLSSNEVVSNHSYTNNQVITPNRNSSVMLAAYRNTRDQESNRLVSESLYLG